MTELQKFRHVNPGTGELLEAEVDLSAFVGLNHGSFTPAVRVGRTQESPP